MAVRYISIAGLQILLLIHMTKAFVLLTANIEDVKKLAMKFVSESLAEKIAAFIAQAAQHMITHASEEVHRDVSEENKKYNTKQISSEREYENNRAIKKKTNKVIYKKDDIFSHLEGLSKYAAKKTPRLNQDGKSMMEGLKFKADPAEDIRKSNVLDGELEKKMEYSSSSSGVSIEDNTLNDGEVKDSSEANFRSKGKEVKDEVGRVELVATSGDLILTRTTEETPSDGEKNESGNKQEKKEEAWF